MSDSPKAEIIDLIGAWLVGLGVPTSNRKGKPYYDMFSGETKFEEKCSALIKTLKAEGYSEEEVRSLQTVSKVLRKVNPQKEDMEGWASKWKRKWEQTAKNQTLWWDILCDQQFGHKYASKLKDAEKLPSSQPQQSAPKEDEAPLWIPPKGKLDLKTYKNFNTNSEWDDTFVNSLKGIKNGR